MLDILAICLVITALLAYLNHRFVGLPTTIGVMAGALVFTLALVGLDALGVARSLRQHEEALLNAVRFPDVVLQGMLSFLLFAGALHVDLGDLERRKLARSPSSQPRLVLSALLAAARPGWLFGASAIRRRSSGACCSAR